MKGKRLDICRQSGEISPNLATLLTNERTNERTMMKTETEIFRR